MLVLSLHSADDTEVEDEEMLEDDDEVELEEEDVDSDVFPSMMIITRFSAGVPSAEQHLNIPNLISQINTSLTLQRVARVLAAQRRHTLLQRGSPGPQPVDIHKYS